MASNRKHLGSPLGNLMAEQDHAMLDEAFVETEDYKSLIEADDKAVVVGRRGTGKSSLFYRLGKYWSETSKKLTVPLVLEKGQVIAIEHAIKQMSCEYREASAVCQILWQYSLVMETALEASQFYKLKSEFATSDWVANLQEWHKLGDSISTRFLRKIKLLTADGMPIAEMLGQLAANLNLKALKRDLIDTLEAKNFEIVLLIDKLDEGYVPSDSCVAMIDGLVEATISFNASSDSIRPILFIRDNIYRTIATNNSDFTRNIEGQTLRLHWNEHQLMHLVGNRIKISFDIGKQSTESIWNAVVDASLKGRDGFRSCLRYTLYRPRDILVLLNQAFYIAHKDMRETLIEADVKEAASQISQHRIDDLHKEYSAIIPGLSRLTSVFVSGRTEWTAQEAENQLRIAFSQDQQLPDVREELAILGNPRQALRLLYSIGFVGILNGRHYTFCHDGNSSQQKIAEDDRLLIHPCYWLALNLQSEPDCPNRNEIHDEYDPIS